MVPGYDLTALPFLALYAETHFRFFRWFPSFLFARQPEVVFDAPRRIGPGHDLPVILVVNDLERFPATLSDCAVAVSHPNAGIKRFVFNNLDDYEKYHPLQSNIRAFVLPIPRADLPEGRIFINARVTVSCAGGRHYTVLNDNLRTSTKGAFTCSIVNDQLPGSEFCRYGDIHLHSNYSQSHVEFGPPLPAIDAVAHASGLSFIAITDHSYDLACSTNDYLVTDPGQTKWRLFQEEIAQCGNCATLILPGEEISCLNGKMEVVHLCGIAIKRFLPGSLDGARKGRKKQQQLSLKDAVRLIHDQGGIAFAAHPGAQPGFLSRILLRRGTWSKSDLAASGIDAMQVLNSGFSKSWQNGKNMWIDRLQNGIKMPLLAGNDAHGDFNRYRATKIPFLAISDLHDRYMGCGKTGIYGNHATIEKITRAIADGETFVTTGPFAGISSSPSPFNSVVSHRPIPGDTTTLFVNAKSSKEFGPVHAIDCFAGVRGNPVENNILSIKVPGDSFAICEKIDIAGLPFKPMYIRAEVRCSASDRPSTPSQAFTSAVYF
jgi:hypothetical protein